MTDDVVVSWRGLAAKISAREGMARGLNIGAAIVQADAVPRTPIEYGDLRDSLVISEATPTDLEAAVSSDLPYAVPQHERLDYHHREGGAKFLENALYASDDDVQRAIETNVRRALEGGLG